MMVNCNDFTDSQIFDIDNPRYISKGQKVDVRHLTKALNREFVKNAYKYIFYFCRCKKIESMINNMKLNSF